MPQPQCHMQPPTITGRYTKASYDFFLKPILKDFQAVGAALKTMARSAAVALRGDGCCQYHQLREDITALEASRCKPSCRVIKTLTWNSVGMPGWHTQQLWR